MGQLAHCQPEFATIEVAPNAVRFARDVLEQSGARWLIILAGLHDIAAAQGDASASIIAA